MCPPSVGLARSPPPPLFRLCLNLRHFSSPLPTYVIFSHRLVPIKGGDHPRPAARYTSCSRRCTLITYSVASISVPSWILCHYAISRRMQRVAVSCASRGCTLRRRCTICRYPRDVSCQVFRVGSLRVCYNASELRRLRVPLIHVRYVAQLRLYHFFARNSYMNVASYTFVLDIHSTSMEYVHNT